MHDEPEFPAIPGLHQAPDEHPLAAVVVTDDSGAYVDERPPQDADAPETEEEDEEWVAAGEQGRGAVTVEAGAVFATLEEWVETWLLNVFRRSVDGHAMTWCREWWRHPEAYLRLDALWRAWEYLRQQPATGMAVWLRDYCDPHMAVLLSESGPFKGCDPTRHSPYELKALAMLPPPSWETLTQAYEALRSREWQQEEEG